MKKLFLLLLALLMTFGCACMTEGPSGDPQDGQTANTPAPKPPSEFAHGMFGAVNCPRGFTVKALKMSGTTGSLDGINALEPSLTLVRSVFELDEWIEYSVSYEYGNEYARLGVWLFPHRRVDEYGDIGSIEEAAFFCEYELPYENYPDALEGIMILPSAYVKSGDYDMLFTLEGELVGGMQLRIVEPGALEGRTDEEIAAMIAVG